MIITAAFFTELLLWSPQRLHAILYTYTTTHRLLFLKSDCIVVLLISLSTLHLIPQAATFCTLCYRTLNNSASQTRPCLLAHVTLPCHHIGSFSSWNALPYLSIFCSAFHSHLPLTYTHAQVQSQIYHSFRFIPGFTSSAMCPRLPITTTWFRNLAYIHDSPHYPALWLLVHFSLCLTW